MTIPNSDDIDVPSELTFDAGLKLLEPISISKNSNAQLDSFLKTNNSAFTNGSLPYKKSKDENISNKNKINSTYKSEIEFISNKLKLDPYKISKLINSFSKNIKNCPTHSKDIDSNLSKSIDNNIDTNNSQIKIFTSGNNSWSSSSNDLLTYFISMIFKQQTLFYKISLNILKSDQKSELKTSIIKNGYNIIDNLINDLNFLNDIQNSLLVSSDLDLLISNNLISLLFELLNYFVYIILQSEKGFTIDSILNWFKLMETTNFLSNFAILSINSTIEIKDSIDSLSTIISLLFLDLDFNFGSLDDDSTFMSNPDNLNDITNYLLNSNSNPVILYAWSIILHRQHIILELNKDNQNSIDYQKKLFKNNNIQNIELMYLNFVNKAIELNICDSLININNLLSYDPFFSNILGSFIISFIPYIEPTEDLINSISIVLKSCSNDIILKFFDNSFTNEILTLLKAKMPLSLNSYLKLISINSNLAVEELRLLPTYTTYINSTDLSNNYSIDDQQPELIKLLSDINIDIPFDETNEVSLLIKSNTKAQILSKLKDNDKTLILILYEYNGWSLLGRLLKNLSVKLSVNDKEKFISRNIIIQFLNDVLIDLDNEIINLILNSMNSFIEDFDVIDILFRIFDQCLQLKDSETLTNLVNLFETLSIKGFSNRIWSFLYKSNLFSFKLNGDLVFDILNKVEIVNGSYSFAIGLLKLGNTLSSLSLNIDDNINTNLKCQVIDYFTILSIRIFQNFSNWKYKINHEKYEIGINILNYFKKIINIDFEIINDINDNFFKVYQSSFKKIVDSFLLYDVDDLRFISPLLLLIDQLSNPNIKLTSCSKFGLTFQNWVYKSFEFSTYLIKLRSLIKQLNPSNFERELFANLINFINIYLFDDNLQIPILNLLNQLVRGNWNGNIPSLLTHLRETHSIILLNCFYNGLSDKNSNIELKISLLKFFSSIMEKNQKGLSLFLISGKSIQTFETNEISIQKYSLYNLVKSLIINHEDHSDIQSYYLLNTISLCISIWHGALSDSADAKFIEVLLKIMEKDASDSNKEIDVCEIEIISKAVEIISLYLFISRGQFKNCEAKIYKLLNSTSFINLLSSKFKINQRDDYHFKKISENFSNITSHRFKLNQFLILNNSKDDVEINKDYYDFKVLDIFFSTQNGNENHNKDWKLIRKELEKTSYDYQIIESQIHLAKSYGGLITCFCNINPEGLSIEYGNLASSLLKVNYEEGIPIELYDQIYKGRIELSFLIILTISQSKQKIEDSILISIITSCLDLLESKEVNLSQGLLSLKIDYYKTLLRILLITVSMIKSSNFITEYSSTLIEVFKNIICKSINILFSSIRNQTLSVPISEFGDYDLISKQIDDILIILSLSQEFFKLDLNDSIESNISNILIKSGAYRTIAQMFKSSHLIKVKGEEVFIDYSMAFIYEFVQRKAIAAKLLDNGIFHLLTESPIALIIEKGHITPYSNNSTIVRLHKLWVGRILPIVLIMISHFNSNITFTICQFALIYKEQFRFAIQGWLETDSLVSSSVIEETEQIVLLAKLLNNLDCYNFVGSELGKSIDDVELVPGLDTIAERKIFVNALTYLLSHPKYLAMKIRTMDDDMSVDQLTEEIRSLKESLLV